MRPGQLAGTGTITYGANGGAARLVLQPGAGNNNGFTGRLIADSGRIDIGGTNGISSNTAYTFNNSAGVYLGGNNGETNFNFGVLDGTNPNAIIQNSTAAQTKSFSVGGKNINGDFGGVIGTNNSSTISIVKVGSATQTLSGANTYNGTTTISGGVLQLGNGGTKGSISNSPSVTLSGGSLAVNRSDAVSQGGIFASAALTGSGGFIQAGTGTTTLTAVNTYTGTTTISAGALKLASGSSLASTNIVVNSSFDLTDLSSGFALANGQTLAGSGSVTTASGQSVSVSSGATLAPGNLGSSLGKLTISSLLLSGGGNYNFGIADADGAAGTGYSTITAPRLNINSLSSANPFKINLWSLSSSSATNGNAANFNFANSYSWTLFNFTTLAGTFNSNLFTINTAATNGTSGFANTATGTWSVINTNNSLVLTYTGIVPANAWTNAAGNLSSISITNTSNLSFSGPGGNVTNDSVAAAFPGIAFTSATTGSYSLSGNDISLGSNGIINSSSSTQTVGLNLLLTNGATANASTGSLVLSGTIDNGGNALTLSGNSNVTVTGNITNSGSLIMASSGTVTLSGTNTFSGGAALNSGTLVVSGDSALGTGVLTNTGNNTLVAAASSSLQNDVKMASGTLTVNDAGNALLLNGKLSGSGSLTKTGLGTVTLGASNSYTGPTIVNAGTLSLGNASALPVSAVTINSGATLTNDYTVSVGAVSFGNATISGTGTLSGTGFTATNTGTATVTVGLAGNTAAFSQTGAGTTTLSGVNTFAGTTTVNSGGTLIVSGLLGNGSYAGNISTPGKIVFAQSGAQTLTGVISGSGGTFANTGTGTTVFSGAQTLTGFTVTNSGTLTTTTNFYLGGGGAVLNNSGTFNSSGGNGQFRMQGTGSNTLNLLSGTANFNGLNEGASATSINRINIFDGATLNSTNGVAVGYTGGNNTLVINTGGIFKQTVGITFVSQAGNGITAAITNNGTFSNTGTGVQMIAQSGSNSTARFVQANGTFYNAGLFYIGGGNQNTTNNYVNNSTGFVNVTGGSFINGGAFVLGFQGFNNTNTLQVDAGTAVLGGNLTLGGAYSNINNVGNAGNYNIVNLNGGSLSVGGIISGGGSNQVNSFNWSGGTLSAASINAKDSQWASNGISTSISNSTLYNTNGVLSPGGAGIAGITAISGNYTQTGNGTLVLDFGGGNAATAFTNGVGYSDQLNVSSNATIAGKVQVSITPSSYYGIGATTSSNVALITASNLNLSGASILWDNGDAFATTKSNNGVTVTLSTNGTSLLANVNRNTWIGSGNWGSGGSDVWSMGIDPNGTNSFAYFSSNSVVNLDRSSTIYSLAFGGGSNSISSDNGSELTLAPGVGNSVFLSSVSGSNSVSAPVTLKGDLVSVGSGTVTLASVNLNSNSVTVNSGTVNLTGISNYTGSTLVTGGSLNLTQDVSGAGSVTVTGGSLNLVGTHSYTGATVLSGGTLETTYNGSTTYTAKNSGITFIANMGVNTPTWTDAALSNVVAQMTNATFGIDATGTTYNLPSIGTTGTAILNTNGGVNLTAYGAGTVALVSGNDYSGVKNWGANGGTLSISNTNALSATNKQITLTGGGVLSLDLDSDTTVANNVTVTSGGFTGSIANNSGFTANLTGTLTKNNAILKLLKGKFTVSGNIVGADANSDLFVSSGADVTLSGSNSFNGPTYVDSDSKLTIGSSNALPANTSLVLGSASDSVGQVNTIDIGAYNPTVSSLQTLGLTAGGASSNVVTGSGTLTVAGDVSVNSNSVLTLQSALTGVRNLNLNGGTLFLSAGSSVNPSASVSMNGGTLNVGNESRSFSNLTLTGNSIINFAGLQAGTSITFTGMANALNGNTLSIYNYTPGAASLVFSQGVDASGLSAADLLNISFYSDMGSTLAGQGLPGAAFSGNEIVPVPEPSVILAAILMVALMAFTKREEISRLARRVAIR